MTGSRISPSDDQVDALAAFSRWLGPVVPDRASDADYLGLWNELSQAGWPLLGVPEEAGGAGADLRELQEFAEEWGKHLIPVPLTTSLLVHRWVGGADRLNGEPTTIAVPASPGAIVPFPTWPSIRCFGGIVEGAPRFVHIPGAQVDEFAPSLPVGSIDEASSLSDLHVSELRGLVAAEAVGVARRVLAMAIAYAMERGAYGRKIVEFQAVRHILADMHRDTELAKTASVWAAQTDEGENAPPVRECLRLCRTVAERSIQIHGGIGFTWDLGLHFYLRHLLALQRLAFPQRS